MGDGCETDVANDVHNCGGCGRDCPSSHGTPACSAGACTYAHLAAAVNFSSVSNPGGATPVPSGGTVEFTVHVPNAVRGTPVEVRYYLAHNLAFQSATAGAQAQPVCQSASLTPLPNGVQGNAQVLDCSLFDGTVPLVLGWLEGGRVLPVWSSGRYVVNAYEDSIENIKVLKLPRKWRKAGSSDPGGLTSGSYYLAVRRPAAPWADWLTRSPSFNSGVAVYMDEGTANASTALIDLTPGSAAGAADFYDGALLAGQTFADAAAGVTVNVVSADATSATVDVSIQPRDTRFIQAGAMDPYGNAVAGSSVLGTGNFASGSNISLTAVPPGGFALNYWLSSAGRWLSAANPYTFPIDDDTLVWAVFRAVAPGNDNFASAQAVDSLPAHITLYTQSATTQTGEPGNVPCGSQSVHPNATVWYSFTSASTQNVAIATRGSDYYTTIAVFTGSAVDGLTLVPGACGFDNATQFAQVTFSASAGTTYYVQIGAWGMGQNLVADFTAGS